MSESQMPLDAPEKTLGRFGVLGTPNHTHAARFGAQAHTAGIHPRRAHIHENLTAGQRAAEAAAASIGSWRFLIGQACILAAWIAFNSAPFTPHFDSFPYILCNLALSFQAAFTGPVLLIAANRAAAKDRARDDTEAREVEQLTGMNEQQLVMLRELQEQSKALDAIARLLHEQSTASVRDPKTGKYVSRKTAS